jgi:hypothetical protein
MNRMPKIVDRRTFIGGSDARIIMGNDELALLRLWQEKRGEVEPEDLSNNLIVQLGIATEDLNRRWYEANTGKAIIDVQRTTRHSTVRWLGATSTAVCRARKRSSRPNSCCPGHFRRKLQPRNTWHSCSTICGWSLQERRCSRSLPAAANGPRSRPRGSA